MKLAVFGTGYVGLVQSACMAELGNEVIGVDTDEAEINNYPVCAKEARLSICQTPIF